MAAVVTPAVRGRVVSGTAIKRAQCNAMAEQLLRMNVCGPREIAEQHGHDEDLGH